MPQFDFWMKKVTGEVTLLEGTEEVVPGDTITVVVTLGVRRSRSAKAERSARAS